MGDARDPRARAEPVATPVGARSVPEAKRLAAMLASLREVVFQTDLAGRWTFLNEAWTRMFGYAVSESLGSFYQSTVHVDDRPASTARLEALIAGESDECRAVFRMHHRDGSIRWVEIVARPLHDTSAATLVGLTGTLNDVTERVAAAQQLERERRRLSTVIDGTRVGVWERDERTDDAWYSREWAEMLGYRLEEIESKFATFLDLIHPDDFPRHQVESAKILTGEAEFFEVQVRMRHRLGHWVWVRTRGRAMEWGPDGSVTVTAGTHTEVTDQVVAEQAARMAQRIDALGRIAGGVAHDFNNLLGVILGTADLLERDLTSGDVASALHAVDVVRSATERAAALTRRLLDVARERAGVPIVLDLNAAVADAHSLIARALPPSVQFECHADGDPLPITADAGQLTDTLLNLAINARDAMPGGGRLTLTTEVTAPDRVALVVSDTGIGIPDELQSRIFDPFFTTKPPEEGTGLGLALVYAFVRQSGGEISVTSQVGAGTTFRLEFPRSTEPLAGRTSTAHGEHPHGRGETVLVVDDEGLLRELTRVQLESAGYRVVTAADARAALAAIDRQPEIALVFTDVRMPGGLDGFELASVVCSRYPGTRVILTSGDADGFGDRMVGDRVVAETFVAPMVAKPYTRGQLLDAVRTALDTPAPGAGDPSAEPGCTA